MKQLILTLAISTAAFFIILSCNDRSKTEAAIPSSSNELNLNNGPDYLGGFSSVGRAFPDKLRGLPVGITVSHYPNPCYAVLEDSMYIWKHNTTVEAKEDLQLVEFGSFVYTSKGWYLRITMDAKEFATSYNCKDGLLKKGVRYTDNTSWRREETLSAGDALWYYIAKDKNDNLVKGTGPIETEGALLNSSIHLKTVVASKITWTGYGEIGNYSLGGTVPVKKVSIEADSANVSAVNLTVDISKLNSDNAQLVEHLKGEDFFDTDKYPSAKFVSENIQYKDDTHALVKGTLTIKEKSINIQFPLLIQKTNNGQIFTGKIIVDRTAFGIRYNSKSFFSDLGDQAIKNNFDLKFEFTCN
jgi:hypothetical protein